MKALPTALKTKIFAVLGALTMASWTGAALGQTFVSGSTGADGAYAPTCTPTPCTVTETLNPTGIYNYTTVTVPAGVTVRWTRNTVNTPVTILATGDVTVAGTLNVAGSAGAGGSASSVSLAGGLGGPGGYNGGSSGVTGGVLATSGLGPGGGIGSTNGNCTTGAVGGSYGAASTFVGLLPLFGGSGGGGGANNFTGIGSIASGASGGGGGGAILIGSSSKIVVSGSIVASGGAFGATGIGGPTNGNGGSGGAIRLVAPQVTGAGALQALAGTASGCGTPAPTAGRIRLEAFTLGFTGTISPTASQTNAPGPVSATSSPSLVALPTIAIASVGGTAAPASPGGSFSAADVSLAGGTTNPVSVVINLTSTPVGSPTAITLRVIPGSGNFTAIAVPAASQAGTFASSSVTVSATLPAVQVSVLQAFASMTLTGQVASLFPLIDGEPVQSVAVASPLDGGRPVLNLTTASGRERRYDELTQADQMKVAVAWQALSTSRQ